MRKAEWFIVIGLVIVLVAGILFILFMFSA